MGAKLAELGVSGALWAAAWLCATLAAAGLTWDAPSIRRYVRPLSALALALGLAGVLLAVAGAQEMPGAAAASLCLALGAWHRPAQPSRASRVFAIVLAWLCAVGLAWAWVRLLV